MVSDVLRVRARSLLESGTPDVWDYVMAVAERAVLEAVAEAGLSMSAAARALGVTRVTLRRKLRQHGLTLGDGRARGTLTR